MKYFYTQRNLLESTPEHYMYSKYAGVNFLIDYLYDRKKFLNKLDFLLHSKMDMVKHLKKIREKLFNLKESDRANHELEFKTQEIILTEATLKDCILQLMFNHGSIGEHDWIIEKFIKKFEVNKRLRISYDQSFRVIDRGFAPLSVYIFLAFIISYKQNSSLNDLNTLLKLNDIICSSTLKETDCLTLHLMYVSVLKELCWVKEIIKKQNLNNSAILEMDGMLNA